MEQTDPLIENLSLVVSFFISDWLALFRISGTPESTHSFVTH